MREIEPFESTLMYNSEDAVLKYKIIDGAGFQVHLQMSIRTHLCLFSV